jgi:hypothetical protein
LIDFRTLEERAKRLFATKDKSVDELDPSLFMKDANKAKRGKYAFSNLIFLLKNPLFVFV